MENIKVNNNKAASVQAYIDYYKYKVNVSFSSLVWSEMMMVGSYLLQVLLKRHYIMLILEQYEAYKADLKKNAKNRVYTSWRNTKGICIVSDLTILGIDCKMIGPATKCICDHRYKDHNYTNAPDKKVHCKVKGCPCTLFYYIPVRKVAYFIFHTHKMAQVISSVYAKLLIKSTTL